MTNKVTRKCIKCGRDLPVGMFNDNWRHKVNVCKDCIRVYHRKYDTAQRLRRLKNQREKLDKEIKWLKEQKSALLD